MKEFDNRRSFKTFMHRHGHQFIGILLLAAILGVGYIGYRESHPQAPSNEGTFGIRTEGHDFEVTVDGFDGEMFSYSIYFGHDITQADTDELDRRIGTLYDDYAEDNYYGDITVCEPDGNMAEIILDLGNADDERMVNKIIYALDGMDGIEKVVINEGAEDN